MLKHISRISNFFVPILISSFGIFLAVEANEQNTEYFSTHPIREFFFYSFQENIILITIIVLFIWLVIYILDWLHGSFFEIEKKI